MNFTKIDMQNSRILTQSILRVAVIDLLLTAAACFIPTASHLLALPLYMLNPMLALLLAGMLLGRDWRGALVLALLMPLVSSIVTGMPSTGKMFCMMAELATVASLGSHLLKRWNPMPAILVAILVGKVVYYAAKAAIVAPTVLLETQWYVQAFPVLLWAGLFSILYRKSVNQ